MKGLFISLEGGEGAGKTLQVKLLADYIRQMDIEPIVVREPGGTSISEQIRSIIIDIANTSMCNATEALLYAAARAQLINEVIRPALSLGRVVICDRFTDSSFVYQSYARGLREQDVHAINFFATGGILPDVTFLLDIAPEEGLARKKKMDALDRIELENLEFHKKVYDGYRKLLEENPDRIITIDAAVTSEEVNRQIITHLSVLLSQRQGIIR